MHLDCLTHNAVVPTGILTTVRHELTSLHEAYLDSLILLDRLEVGSKLGQQGRPLLDVGLELGSQLVSLLALTGCFVLPA